jgi:CBS domain-containing protein
MFVMEGVVSMKVKDVMTPSPQVIAPDADLSEAAALMGRLNVGALPVSENDRVIGIITDRDITVRATAESQAPDTEVREVMTPQVTTCHEDDDIKRCANLMEKKQIRRLPVLSKDNRLVGIVSLGDLAIRTDQQLSGSVLERVSEPAEKQAPPGSKPKRTAARGPSEGTRPGDLPAIRPEARGRQFR